MAIFDSTRMRILVPGQEGEIATRGPHVCKSCFKDPEPTAATFSSDGWLFSGDLGVINESGYPDLEIVQQTAAQMHWNHHMKLLDAVKDPAGRIGIHSGR